MRVVRRWTSSRSATLNASPGSLMSPSTNWNSATALPLSCAIRAISSRARASSGDCTSRMKSQSCRASRSRSRFAMKPGNPVMRNVSLSGIRYPEYNSALNSSTIRGHHHMNFRLMFVRRTALALVLFIAFFSIAAQEKTRCNVKVTLLQVNDVYQFAPVDQGNAGGLGRVLTLRKSIQQQNPNTLLLLAGDTISPSVESITYKGAQMIEAWNAIGLDYATYGNHEFDFGPDVLAQRVTESKFGWIAANVIDKRTGQVFGGAKPYVVREFGGVKIGIFGLVLPETKTTSRPGPNVEFRSP